MRLKVLRTGLRVAASCILLGCDGSPAVPEAVSGSFVAQIAGTDAFVAVVTDGAEVRAYVCDGAPDRELTVSEWFKGTYGANDIDLGSMSGGARMLATVRPGGVSGRIERPGSAALSFTALPAAAPSGFYLFKKLVNDELFWAGWIVTASGERRGAMASPARTSLGVTLNLAAGTAQLPGGGTVRPGLMTPSNLVAGMCGPPLCGGFP